MPNILKNKSVAKDCKIYGMLASQNAEHFSFHTPGHKIAGWDITELAYSDNLACPRGCIAEAEKDISEILGSQKSFLLTDGSTAGVLSMLYAAKSLGVRRIAVCESSHKSVFNGCKLLGLTPLVYPCYYIEKNGVKIPYPPTVSALKRDFPELLDEADGIFLTSPNYYGNVADLSGFREYCDGQGKLLLVDGAHGGHLHFDKRVYAGAFADLWVDGVHKSLPAFTQGAVVSARSAEYAEKLAEGLDIFRTTSPSYPIMASVEYAVKYPRNEALEKSVKDYANGNDRVYLGEDWTKFFALFKGNAFAVEKELCGKGIYAEFCDGDGILFYLSPATDEKEWTILKETLDELFARYPLQEKSGQKGVRYDPSPLVCAKNGEKEWLGLAQAEGRISAAVCGLFPPCTPLLQVGEVISGEKLRLLANAGNVFGLKEGKISVYKEN